MAKSKGKAYGYCSACGCRKMINGKCQICGSIITKPAKVAKKTTKKTSKKATTKPAEPPEEATDGSDKAGTGD